MIPLVSVVITTKNEKQNIENCLKSIKGQSYSKIEIIVVDNFSTDKTKEIALRYTDKVYDKGPERSAQRNYGVEQSSGEYFLQLDADQIIKNDVIEECVKKVSIFKTNPILDYKNIALQIPEIIIGGSGFFNKIRIFEKQFYTGTVIDCVRFIPIKVFRDLNGFDLSLNGPEDWDLDQRIREVCFVDVVDSCMDHNEGVVTFLKFLKKKWYYSATFDKYVAKWGKDNLYVKKRLGFRYRYIGVFTEKGKWKIILKHPILFLSLLITKICVGFIFILRIIFNKFKKYE